MWTDGQRDGRPAEYRWRRLRKFSSIPCRLPRHKVWLTAAARVSCSHTANIGERNMCAMAIFASCIISASPLQHISDMYSKFALRPPHVWKYGRHPICNGRD